MKHLHCLLTFLVLLSDVAHAATYYVAPQGSDANAGTLASPWRSINHGALKLVAGDTLHVRGGVYAEKVSVGKSGTPSAPITIAAYPDESPVIDATAVPIGNWDSIVTVRGQYLHLSGFEVRNINLNGAKAGGHGIYMGGAHNTVGRMNVHDTWANGIMASGDHSVVEDCRVWRACLNKSKALTDPKVFWGAGLTAARDPVNGITDGAILRRNIVYHNFGEGLSSWEASGTVVEDNIVYDNFAVNLYLSDTADTLVQRNIVYTTQDSTTLFGRPTLGIALSNEVQKNPLRNVTIINNVVFGTSAPFVFFRNTGPPTLRNVLIANNTFVNGVSGHGGGTTVVFAPGDFRDVEFKNNLVLQEDSRLVAEVADGVTGISFANNLWSKPPPAAALSPTDVIGNPQLAKAGSPAAGKCDPDLFRLLASSPAINKAAALPQVPHDFFKVARGGSPDIGAHEYVGGVPERNLPPAGY